MGNMAYCRFENTLRDLRDCRDNWEYPEETKSESELKAREKLLQLCKEIVDDYIW